MTLRRGLIALLLAGFALIATAAPALAHTTLRSSNPANGATLATPPTQVSLTFGEAVTLPGNPIRVTGPGGAAWTVGKASVTDATVSAPVTATGPAGAYTLTWSVVSDDGDTISGKINFTLKPAPAPVVPAPAAPTSPAAAPTTTAPATTAAAVPTPVPAAAQTADSGGGVPWWVWIVGAAVVLAGVGGAVAARGRRTGG
jgi:copper resistance protein C